MKMPHTVDPTTLKRKVAAVVAVAVLAGAAAAPAVTITAKARHDAMRQVQPTR